MSTRTGHHPQSTVMILKNIHQFLLTTLIMLIQLTCKYKLIWLEILGLIYNTSFVISPQKRYSVISMLIGH